MSTPLTIKPVEYLVTGLPLDDDDMDVWSLRVTWRGGDQWAVMRHRYCLSVTGEWDFEPSPSNREDDWVATHRFTFQDAAHAAERAYPDVIVNGLWVRDGKLVKAHE